MSARVLAKDLVITACVTALTVLLLSGCTSGRLAYLNEAGERQYACATEYSWQPRVDKYAVQYVLAYCAQQAVLQGYQVVDSTLLTLDLAVPPPPAGKRWSHALAKQQYQQGQLSDQEYGYVIAYLDLGHDTL